MIVSILGLKHSHVISVHTIALSISTNAVSIAVLNDIGMPRLVCNPFNYVPYEVVQRI